MMAAATSKDGGNGNATETVAAQPTTPAPSAEPIDRALLWIVSSLIGAIMILLIVSFALQYSTYRDALTRVAANEPGNYVAIVTYLGAWDGAVTKTSCLFLSFVLILVGALYVLRTAQMAYSVSVEGGGAKGALQTTSPGLVILTLGIVALALSLFKPVSVDLSSRNDQPGGTPTAASSVLDQEQPATEYKSPKK
jgi:hypothetical protein